MSDEQHSSPLKKLHLPWKRRDEDEESKASSEKKLHLPWKRHGGDEESNAASEKQPLVQKSPSTPTGTPKKKEAYGSFTINNARISRVWDVKMPPAKKTMVHGVLVPTMGGTFGSVLIQKKRRIAIEIHSEDSLGTSNVDGPSSTLLRGNSLDSDHDDDDTVHVGEKAIVRVLKPASKGDSSDDSSDGGGDHQTVSTIGFHAADEESDMWVTNYVLGLDDVEILKARGSHCEIKLGHGSDTQVRHVNFSNEKEALSFRQVMEKLFKLKAKLTEQRVRDFRELSPVANDGMKIRLLIEIVSGIGLPVADRNATDPYVIVRLGSQEVHRTPPIYST